MAVPRRFAFAALDPAHSRRGGAKVCFELWVTIKAVDGDGTSATVSAKITIPSAALRGAASAVTIAAVTAAAVVVAAIAVAVAAVTVAAAEAASAATIAAA